MIAESGQRFRHAVNGVGKFRDLAFRFDEQLLLQVATCNCSHDFGNAAHLVRQVAGHEIHAVGQIFPGPGDTMHVCLSSQLAFRAYFAGHTSHFRGERIELVHHGVDRVFQLQDFAPHIDRDFFRQVPGRNRSGNVSNIAHLRSEIARHRIHTVGQIFPGAGDAFHFRLATEFSFAAYLPGHACYFRGEGTKLIHHRVDGVLELQNFAAHIDRDFLG